MKFFLQIVSMLVVLLYSSGVFAREHMVYGIDQEIPMGEPGEVVKKNYYVNMGEDQGLSPGTLLNVYRLISLVNPYNPQKRYNHKVKVAEIKVIHTEKTSSIGRLVALRSAAEDPVFDFMGIMIGDRIEVNVD